MWLIRWLSKQWKNLRREASVPPPPWRASKRVAVILNGVWYGRLTPDQARKKAVGWGWPSKEVEELISQATQPPSYWSREHDVKADT